MQWCCLQQWAEPGRAGCREQNGLSAGYGCSHLSARTSLPLEVQLLLCLSLVQSILRQHPPGFLERQNWSAEFLIGEVVSHGNDDLCDSCWWWFTEILREYLTVSTWGLKTGSSKRIAEFGVTFALSWHWETQVKQVWLLVGDRVHLQHAACSSS